MEINTSGFDIDAPRWDQGTFLGRVKHFFNITDPRTILVPEHELDWAKAMVERSRTMPAVIFWQWVNQSFNALVNYTNRNAASPMSVRQMAFSYLTATTTAVATAVGMNMWTKRAPPLVCRWVPFAAVAAANCVNIPMMRQQELIQGISVQDKNHNEVGHSQRAAAIGIAQVVISRITMAAPGMILLPVIMERLEKLHFMKPPLHGTSGMWALSTDVCLASFLSGTRSSRRCRGQGRKTCTLCLFQQGSLNASCQQGPACEYLLLCTPVPTFLLAHKA
nr:sideroflexin-2 isoform X4 [Cavia porcellus]